MTIEQLVGYGAALVILVIPIIATVLVDRKPELLSPMWKLRASLILVGLGFAIPLVLPVVLTALAPLTPFVVWLLCPLLFVPQGFVGAGIAGAILALELDRHAARNPNFMWWSVSLLGTIWTAVAIIAVGWAYSGW